MGGKTSKEEYFVTCQHNMEFIFVSINKVLLELSLDFSFTCCPPILVYYNGRNK
jgi:hypothetical protein